MENVYYEIQFYGQGHEQDFTFYLTSDTPLSDDSVIQKLTDDFLGVDGLEMHHLTNVVAIIPISAQEFTDGCGIDTQQDETFVVTITMEVTAKNETEALAYAIQDINEVHLANTLDAVIEKS